MKKIRSLLDYIKNVLIEFFSSIASFFKESWKEILGFKKQAIILIPLICLQIGCLVSASYGFRDNVSLSIFASSINVTREIKDKGELNLTFYSKGKKFSSNELLYLETFVNRMNNYTYRSSHTFLSPINSDGSNMIGSVISISPLNENLITSASFNCGVVNFCNYNHEVTDSPVFSGAHLEKVFSTYETLAWRGFNFEGKDGSSFISSVLADVLIAADPNDQYTDYESLIGSKMIYELNGDSYAFSINNIYRADTWFGPSVSATFQYPFITDCDRLYLNNDISLFASSMGDFGEFSELIYQLALQEDNGLDFGCYFVKSVNEKEPYPEEAYLVNLIKHASDSGSSLINGNNIPAFTMLVVLLVLNLIASVYIGYKFTFSKWKSGLAIASATSLLFILISGLLFIIFGAGLKASIILNPVYGGIGVLMPFVILGIALLVGKIKKGHFKI